MRFLISALLVLLLAACASPGPTAPSAASDPQAAADFIRKTSTAKDTVDVDKQSVGDLTTKDSDLWARIRRGFQIPDLQSDLVDMQTTWYTERPDYVQRMTERSQKYLYHIVEELEARNMPTELALSRRSSNRPTTRRRCRSRRPPACGSSFPAPAAPTT